MMNDMIARFPGQLREAISIGRAADIRPLDKPVHSVYVAGMGGSGIGANFVAEFVREELKVPYLVGKGYDIPAHIGPGSLVMVSSYSGNTEETLSAYNHIKGRGARVIVVASGGQLLEAAQADGLDFIRLPDNWSSPRACLGYSMVQQLVILERLGLIGAVALEQVAAAADFLERDMVEIRHKAERIAPLLHDKIPVIYTTSRMEAVAVRFRQQVNENAKMLCWHHVIPEMNHNELVGWRDRNDKLAVLFFRNRDDYSRNTLRIDIIKEIIGNYTGTIIDLYSKGEGLIQRSLYFVHLGDWISWYLAELHGVDAVEVRVIDFLKKELSES